MKKFSINYPEPASSYVKGVLELVEAFVGRNDIYSSELCLRDVEGYLKCQKAALPIVLDTVRISYIEEKKVLYIDENRKCVMEIKEETSFQETPALSLTHSDIQ